MCDIEIVTRLNRQWATIWANTDDGAKWIKKAGLGKYCAGIIPEFLVCDYVFKIKNEHLKAKVITYDN